MVARLLAERRNAVALTGAGISVESGIPAFRGTRGLWEKYAPMEYATIGAFIRHPEKSWRMLSELLSLCHCAAPNAAHSGLAELESLGLLRAVITQNVDRLHQAAGTRRVIEYHGNMEELVCIACWKSYSTRLRWNGGGDPPRCDCGEILKPNIVLFGEPIPWLAQERAEEEARTCGVLLVIGTSAQVTPACDIPRIAKKAGAAVVEINPEETALTGTVTDIHIPGSASDVVRGLLAAVNGLPGAPKSATAD
ncbi:MAG: NAD-dependent deacylase [Deltaproteobacteria bacterium]|nr:NAD-dependent deacylase [Deltaproteobacteria bacterium]